MCLVDMRKENKLALILLFQPDGFVGECWGEGCLIDKILHNIF